MMQIMTYSDRFANGAKRMHQARRCISSRHGNNTNGLSNCNAVSANCTHTSKYMCTYVHTVLHSGAEQENR